MDLIYAIVMGGVIGWLASLVMKTNAQMGILANVAVGVGGALMGYWLAGLLGVHASGGLGRLAIAFGGAVLLIIILRRLGVLR